ncbi:NADP-dependent oxidoreductase domain-containing protein 1 isoform X2 [Ascaphus truei]|uniref:NADP-dependent oxidoreductase domain-containing protein 1 isoform X2 n=1 Tax=Ascaphus truei TaxID=8439 RepID=UPI003F5985F0
MMFEVTDLTANLSSLQCERGVGFRHERFLHLGHRSHALTLSTCAHCVFFCKLLCSARQQEDRMCSLLAAPRIPQASCREGLRVGIVGGGHLGKQLARCLVELSGLQAQDIRISTRRPETLRELQQLGVDCFYNNAGLATWAHVLFLCCLPSQLPSVCAEIQAHLGEACIVYSLVSAAPLPRLKQLLSHCGVIRPEYRCGSRGGKQDKKGAITAALRDASVVKATSPGDPQSGEVRIVSRWIEAAVYAALNMCTLQGLSHQQSLSVLNTLIRQPLLGTQGEKPHCSLLRTESFVNQAFASSLSGDSPFPWFDLHSVQMKETPFSQYLASSPQLREHFAMLYCASFGVSLSETSRHLPSLPSPRPCGLEDPPLIPGDLGAMEQDSEAHRGGASTEMFSMSCASHTATSSVTPQVPA